MKTCSVHILFGFYGFIHTISYPWFSDLPFLTSGRKLLCFVFMSNKLNSIYGPLD